MEATSAYTTSHSQHSLENHCHENLKFVNNHVTDWCLRPLQILHCVRAIPECGTPLTCLYSCHCIIPELITSLRCVSAGLKSPFMKTWIHTIAPLLTYLCGYHFAVLLSTGAQVWLVCEGRAYGMAVQ
jgi:hypothetical protein